MNLVRYKLYLILNRYVWNTWEIHSLNTKYQRHTYTHTYKHTHKRDRSINGVFTGEEKNQSKVATENVPDFE